MAQCDPQTLMNDGACFYCLGAQEALAIELQLLCEILNSLPESGS